METALDVGSHKHASNWRRCSTFYLSELSEPRVNSLKLAVQEAVGNHSGRTKFDRELEAVHPELEAVQCPRLAGVDCFPIVFNLLAAGRKGGIPGECFRASV